MRPTITCLAVACLAASLAAAAAASPAPARISQSAIGSVRLGQTAAQYAAALHEQPFITRYGDRSERLLFRKAELSVFLNRAGRGARITTAAQEYALARGLGPCGTLSGLARAKRLVPVAITGPFGSAGTVYRDGNLWFTLSDPKHIGSVTLAVRRPDLQALIGAAQCGVGDEHGE